MKHFNVLFMALLLLVSIVVKAQQAAVTGKVTDKGTGEELAGANIYIKGTTIGVSTDLDGNYTLGNLQPGKYTIVCSFISYKTQEFPEITLNPGQRLALNIMLESDAFLIEGVTVVARRATNTDLALISSIKSSEQVLSGISSQQIKRSQDSDAAQVVKRVPGVIVIDGRFINIRGLSERYNTVLLHDVVAPSMEADVRSFSFDIIPSNLIDRIMIYKSPAAELPGDFAGGVVKIYTKGIPDVEDIQVSYNAGFVEGVSLGKFYRAPQDKMYWTGFNSGKYNLPSSFPADLRKIYDNPDLRTEAGRSLNNAWVADELSAMWNHSGSLNMAKRIKLSGKQYLGSISSLSYSNNKNVLEIERKDFNSWDPVTGSSVIYRFNDERHVQNIRLGVVQNFAWSITPEHIIEWKNLFNQFSQAEYIHRTGPHYDFGFNANNHSFYQIYRGVYTTQLTGNHKFDNKNSLDWVLGFGLAYRDEPDYRRYRSDLDTVTLENTLYVPFGAAAAYFLGRFFSEMREHNYTVNANYSRKLGNIAGIQPVLNAGFFTELKDRRFDARNIGYVRSSITNFNQNLLRVSIDSLFHPQNINSTTGIAIDEQSNPSDSYTSDNTNFGGFASVFAPLGPRLNLTFGLRLENNLQRLDSYTLTNDPVNVELSEFKLLPSASITFNLNQDMVLRAAYGRTTNRPEFRELAPFGFYDFNYNLVKKGNDSIVNATIDNFDLRWEWYPSASEIINFGVFYKLFDKPIETTFVPGGGSGGIKTFTYANAASAYSFGLEAEVRKSLKGLTKSGFIDRLSIMFNGSLIQSKVKLGSAGIGQKLESRPLFGQSPYIVNAGLYFSDPISQTNFTALFNVIGRRIYIVGFDDYPDIYEMPRNLLDLTLTKNFGKHIELKAGVSNLLGAPALLLQDGNQDGKFDDNIDQRIQYNQVPRNYTLGITYTF
ncbi:MAG TPA: TonB-dependent receptor [Bacteroidales bacterium]|nr:TonB-dependent receptor [Bacteroidales bacterium]